MNSLAHLPAPARTLAPHMAAALPPKRRRHVLDWMALACGYVAVGCAAILLAHWLPVWVSGWLG